jgi:ferric-dicitrate binding protein FerR (iron transport regulator)
MNINRIKIRPRWKKSKEEIWQETFDSLPFEEIPKTTTVWFTALKYAAALIFGVFLFGSLYKVEHKAVRGQHLTVYLPDNSRVTLNADSKISYKPCLWFLTRNVKLEGEGFFEVKPGSRFSVKSGQYRVSVLGTEFNVYARSEQYRVNCVSGRVEVTANKDVITLTKDMQVIFHTQKPEIESDTQWNADWMQNKFSFFDTPLADVVAEIERQYDIRIVADKPLNQRYTGTFTKTESPEDILEIVGKPFGITFKTEK